MKRFSCLLAASVILVSCETTPTPKPTPNPSRTVGAASFLKTDHEALEEWLNERFEVEYRNMTSALIFKQDPIADIRYEQRNMPGDGRLFYLKSQSISRREILKAVADFYDLRMEVKMINGLPAYVLVSGRQGSSAPSSPYTREL